MTSSKVFSGYHAIALPLPHSSFRRFIYAKQHDAKPGINVESVLAAGRTAYLVNLPVHASEQWLRACLEPLGAIQHVVADRGDYSTRKTREMMVDDLETPAPSKPSYAAVPSQPSGLSVIKEMADRYMASFDEMEAEDLRRREELKSQVDDDGFQTVVNTKKRGIVQTEEVLARPAKKQKSKELDNFSELKTLRERFEEDRQLVEKMKKANKFRPE
ncbi:Ribosomal RNA-processing protein 7 [Phytophthora cactorum]|nr:Ribosomal RNA-processing protein 7 [Phytophthora cactorum]